ncbi:MAG: DNA translocase FtsK [Chloroflexi bacterium]|nr:DNA translocase FtsK [Chloroflexota bacterium]
MVRKRNTKKKTPTYRNNKKPAIRARAKAPKTIAERKNKKAIQPSDQIRRIAEWLLVIIGIVLLFSGTFALGSLAFHEMNDMTGQVAASLRGVFGKTAGFISLLTLAFGAWLLFFRKIKTDFSISRKIFAYLIALFVYITLLIQRFAVIQTPFGTSANGGGVLAEVIDQQFVRAIGNVGVLILYFFMGVVFLLIAWRAISRRYSDQIQQNIESTSMMLDKAKTMFLINHQKGEEEDDAPVIEDFAKIAVDSALEESAEDPKRRAGKYHTVRIDSRDKEPFGSTDSNKDDLPPWVLDPELDGSGESPVQFTPLLINDLKVESKAKTAARVDPWKLPDKDQVLDPLHPSKGLSPDDPSIREQISKIEAVLERFNAPGKVIETKIGPTFTQFGVEPGFLDRSDRKVRVRVKQIEALQKDLEMALSVKQMTVEAPIPGKTYVGLQVKNKRRVNVTLREAIEDEAFSQFRGGLPIALGKDINGEVFSADLTRMPHLLIAGSTGSGKSVCLNAILVCLLMHNSPDRLKLVLIDPKKVELSGYNNIPHMLTPVVTDIQKASQVLQFVLREMDRRNQEFVEVGVRNIQEYNAKKPEKPLPYLVVVIDELADLMKRAASDVESSITRLAQTARAMGIHLIIATQRPSRDVLTGAIKGNLPSRIAFAVATNVDSMVILDRVGAENLFGKGDMYLMSAEALNLRRLQCVYVSDDEIKRVVDYWRQAPRAESEQPSGKKQVLPETVRNPLPFHDGMLTQLPLLAETDESAKSDEDPLLQEAIILARTQGRASTNMLVSRLGIGFSRANKLMINMEEAGIISPPGSNPALPRTILDYGDMTPPLDD